MEAIILTSEQFDKLTARIEEIKTSLDQKLEVQKKIFMDNNEFITLMKISARTAQKWRDEGIIAFSQIGNKIYYKMADVHSLLDRNAKKGI